MPEDDDNDTKPAKPGATVGDPGARTRASVTWRGIVDEPEGGAPPKKRGAVGAIGRFFSAIFVGLGLKRTTNDDGTRGPRHLGRFAGFVGAVAVVVLLTTMTHFVPPGYVTVPVTFGSAGQQLSEGLRITAPWPITQTNDMSIQTQNYTMTAAKVSGTDDPVSVLGKDGGSANVDATVLYRLDPNRATDVLRDIGLDYRDKLIRPAARSCIKLEFANVPMVSAATDAWGQVSSAITDCLRRKIEPVGITLQDFQLREIALSADLQSAINAKVAAQQNLQSQGFLVDTAQKQADIQRITAQATSDAQKILACGATVQSNQDGTPGAVVPNPNDRCDAPKLTQEILQYSYIQALREIGKSNNTTVVLGTGSSPVVQVPTPGATPGTTP